MEAMLTDEQFIVTYLYDETGHETDIHLVPAVDMEYESSGQEVSKLERKYNWTQQLHMLKLF